jgi:periplasmic protein TonB
MPEEKYSVRPTGRELGARRATVGAMTDKDKPRPSASTAKKRALAIGLLFLLLSASLHFVLGPTIEAIAPHWQYAALPDQAMSIVTLSHRQQTEVQPAPTPTPTPPPSTVKRTKRELALLADKEMASQYSLKMRIVTPSRRTERILIDHPQKLAPNVKAPTAPVVSLNPEPTPEASPTAGAARVDTTGTNEETASMEWGDDNPARIVKRAALAIDDAAPGIARVEVQVGPDGQVLSVELLQSSGNTAVDDAALEAAQTSTFAPATVNGVPVHGACVLDFVPTGPTS